MPIRRLPLLVFAIAVVAACSGASPATPSAAAPTAGASLAAGPSVVGSPGTLPSAFPTAAAITALAGRWVVSATNPRVVLATGNASGGSVSIEGNRFSFQAGSYKSSGPIDFVGEIALDCTATRCRITGTANMPIPPQEIRVVAGRLGMVSSATLEPYGSNPPCGQPDLPGGGIVTVTRTTSLDGKDVPAEVTLTAGAWGGVGAECSSAGYQLAFDLKATRLPG